MAMFDFLLPKDPAAQTMPYIPGQPVTELTPSPEQPSLANVISPAAPPTPAKTTAAPPTNPEEYNQRVSGWTSVLEKLKDPNVAGPLQTFFTALTMPYGPGENAMSHIGRAAGLYNLHRTMLDENARNQPYQEQMRDAELQHKQAQARGASASADKTEQETRLGAATFDSKVAQAEQEYKNAVLLGDVRAIDLAGKKLEQSLLQKYGDREAALKLDKIKAEIDQSRASAEASNALAALRARTDPNLRTGSASSKDVSKMSPEEIADEINAVTTEFRATGAATMPMADFSTWLNESKGASYAARFTQLQQKLQSAGGSVEWKTGGQKQSQQDFQTGAIYIDGSGNRAKNLGNGKWQEVK